MSKICTYCGAEIEEGLDSCSVCGKPAAQFAAETEAADIEVTPAAESGYSQQQYGTQQQSPYAQQNAQYSGQGYTAPYGTPPYGGAAYGYGVPPQYQPYGGYGQGRYMGQAYPQNEQMERPASVGRWMVTILLLVIPIVGIIYFIIMLVGSRDIPKSVTNFARAIGIYILIGFGITLILTILFMTMFYSVYDEEEVRVFLTLAARVCGIY